jgi:hypothetical protein
MAGCVKILRSEGRGRKEGCLTDFLMGVLAGETLLDAGHNDLYFIH